jgi:Asp-tRNA(Asn)/Glu-tRNA(Gln) amidotransferase A subunit family amidase
VGWMLVGKRNGDRELLAVAAALEQFLRTLA